MQKVVERLKKLPWWAPWLVGWAGVVLVAVGLVYLWRVIFHLQGLPAAGATMAVAGIFSLLYLALFLLCRLREKGVCGRAALLVFLLGLLFCFSTAPLQVPDEEAHFLRMWSISSGRFSYDYTETYPDDVNLLVEAFPAQMNHRITYGGAEMAPAALAEYRMAVQAGEAPTQRQTSPIMFMLIPYAPGALFMAAARLFGFGALGQMYAGRLANLVVYALLCWLAFRNAARYRGVLFGFALLPLSLFMAASCSYDSLMLGLCWLLVSFACRERMTGKALVVFGIALMGAVYIKPINLLLAAVLLLVPKGAWQVKWKRWQATGLLVAAGLAVYFAMGFLDGGLLKLPGWPQELPRGSGEEANPAAQLGYVLRNPLRFLAVAVHSLVESDGFLFDLGRLGGMDLVLPMVGGLSAVSLLFAALRSAPQEAPKKLWMPLGAGLLALLYIGGTMAGIYVQVNDLYSIRVTELQPRYFLPAFMLLALCASQLFGRAMRPRLQGQEAVLRAERACLIVAGLLAFFAVVLLFQSSWVGQWLPKSEGGWKLVNLFGWVQR